MAEDNPSVDALIREAVDVLTEGFAILDPEHHLLFANSVPIRDFGRFYASLFEGKSWLAALELGVEPYMPGAPKEEIQTAAAELYDRFKSGEPVDLTTDRGTQSRVVYRPMQNGRWAAISTDISDLTAKEAELTAAKQRAEAASEAKSAFLANISHEIRTPLNGMLGMAQVLSTGTLSGDQREQVDAILDSGKTLIALLNDVLDLSKIEAGKMEVSPVDSDLSHILQRLYRLWQPLAEENGLELTLDLAASLPARLKLDPVRVRQCIANLMSNAVKFTEGGEVNVHASMPKTGPNAGLVQIKVTDTGIGMDEATVERLFSPFTQADGSTTRRFGGSGLGLSISRRLAQMMGGDVTVKSTPGEGSTFVLSFAAEPAAEIAPVPAGAGNAHAAPRARSALSVLVVDDVPLNRKVARLFLEHQGWTVVEAAHGGDALTRLAEQAFDVVLLDVHMPVMDGPETLKRIRESGAAWANVAVIALTANAMSGDRERYTGLGMDGYVAKPIDQRELFVEIDRVRAAVSQRAAA